MSKKSEYEKLRKLWYKKLKDEGFNDIEQDEDRLKVWSSDLFSRNRELRQGGDWQSKQAYYNMAGHFLNEYHFHSKLEQITWEYHANGVSIRDIVLLLKKIRVKTNRDAIWRIISRHQKIMKTWYIPGYDEKKDE